ncbi:MULTISPECIES: hypothetical protein [Paenibacillus]|nr:MULTISPECIES: hypothetical protein [Paenibacillus]MCP1306840.1 hypothetical protein [Paenibacillus tyrfis]
MNGKMFGTWTTVSLLALAAGGAVAYGVARRNGSRRNVLQGARGFRLFR